MVLFLLLSMTKIQTLGTQKLSGVEPFGITSNVSWQLCASRPYASGSISTWRYNSCSRELESTSAALSFQILHVPRLLPQKRLYFIWA